ncbi:Sister chromatid cohesion protein DCC1 [Terramyces sp. JEL0728]|nr:Sister chromatid cohesion protein DCC1 [Terramyces sp. JEL0728]
MLDCEIYFGDNALPPQDEQQNPDKSIMLLQVPMEIAKRIEAGEEFHFRGDRNDEAVLCTENKTFKIRYAETSNLMLVLKEPTEKSIEPDFLCEDQEMDDPDNAEKENKDKSLDLSSAYMSLFGKKQLAHESLVIDSGNVFLDLVEIKPNYDSLFNKLALYKGEETEYQQEMVTTNDIFQFCQASEQEIKEYLQSVEAIELKGYWRLLDVEYQSEILELILLTLLEHDLPMDNVPAQVIVDSLREYEHLDIVILHVLRIHSNPDSDIIALDEQKICRTFGHVVLKKGDNVMLLKSFMLKWKTMVPELFEINLDFLNVKIINSGTIFVGETRR